MAHFAEIDAQTNLVSRVLAIDNSIIFNVNDASNESLGALYLHRDMGLGGIWKQTSYSGNFRKNFAGVGFTYDAVRDAFIAPKPYPSWVLDAVTCKWIAPIPQLNVPAIWNETILNWRIK